MCPRLKGTECKKSLSYTLKYILKRWIKSAKYGMPYEYEQEMANETKQHSEFAYAQNFKCHY